jgi:23S rRNA (uracil1939-C5)-methyltransferase
MTNPILKIENIAYGGKGVARLDGKVYFVTSAVTGDEVEVEITKNNKNFAEAKITKFIVKSPLRGTSNCEYSDECGGCQWLEIDYAQQIEWKQSFIEDALTRIGKFAEAPSIEFKKSPQQYNYRNRILLRVHTSPNTQPRIGFFKTASRDLIPIELCQIARPLLNEFIKKFSELRLDVEPQKFRIEIQELPNQKQILATFFPADPKAKGLEKFVRETEEFSITHWAGKVFDLKNAPFADFDTQNGISFLTQAGQFQQVNFDHNQNMRTVIKEQVDHLNPERILDLFCGSGNLSLPLADGERKIEGVEFNKKAIEVAKENVKNNSLKNISYFAADAEKYLAKSKGIFDLLIVDPPRQGMAKTLPHIGKLNANNIIYVSCDPTTLARDLRNLADFGYSIDRLFAFDFFPNTFHIETIAVLSK